MTTTDMTTTEQSEQVTALVNAMRTDLDRTMLAPAVERILAQDAVLSASDAGQRIWQQDTFHDNGQRLFQKMSKTSPALYAVIVEFADALVHDGIAAALLSHVTILDHTDTRQEGLYYSPQMGLYMVYGSTMMAPKIHQFATLTNDLWMDRLNRAVDSIVVQLNALRA